MLKVRVVCILVVVLVAYDEFADSSPIDLNKEVPSLVSHNNPISDEKNEQLIHILSDALNRANNRPDWTNDNYNEKSPRRSTDELNALLNDVNDAQLFNQPMRSLDREKLQSLPLLQYIIIRKQSILYNLQEKRSHDYNPRLGRSSTANDDDDNQPLPAPRNSNQALFAPRLGKKSLEFSPRLGRSFYSE